MELHMIWHVKIILTEHTPEGPKETTLREFAYTDFVESEKAVKKFNDNPQNANMRAEHVHIEVGGGEFHAFYQIQHVNGKWRKEVDIFTTEEARNTTWLEAALESPEEAFGWGLEDGQLGLITMTDENSKARSYTTVNLELVQKMLNS